MQCNKETKMLNSDYRALCEVRLPYKGRQHYMHSFDLAAPLMREGYEDYLGPVLALCRAAGATHGIAHMTVDEKIVEAGRSQRRPRPHVDGCFIPGKPHRYLKDAIGDWGGGGGGGWLHYCNDIGRGPIARMAVIVAATAPGCRAWRGVFQGEPKDDGDLTHIADQLGTGEVLTANVGYLLAPDCVHESMLMERDTQRTFLRIALPL
jgi:hypothetical protein